MKPVHHLLFGFVVTLGFFALFLPEHITWQVVFLAVVSGFLPDFDHREWLWRLVAFAVFVGFFAFFANSLFASMPGDAFLAGVGAFATAAVISWAIYAAHPFTRDVFELNERKTQFAGAEGWFLALYVLVVFAATLSPELAIAALIGYASHWVLDYAAYQTYFGRKWLVNYPAPEKPMGWHVRRLQFEEARKRKAKLEKAMKTKESRGNGKNNDKNKNGGNGKKKGKLGKPTGKHSFFLGPGLTEESHEHGEHDEPDLGEHSLASDQQIIEESELHHEEAHGGSAGH